MKITKKDMKTKKKKQNMYYRLEIKMTKIMMMNKSKTDVSCRFVKNILKLFIVNHNRLYLFINQC